MNKRAKRHGHLWQERFYSCALDEPHVYLAVRYVERNPVRAGLVQRAEEYRWSRARGHVGRRCADPLVARGDALAESIADWRVYVSEREAAEWRGALRRATSIGPAARGGRVPEEAGAGVGASAARAGVGAATEGGWAGMKVVSVPSFPSFQL